MSVLANSSFFFKKSLIHFYFVCMNVLYTCMYMCNTFVHGACVDKKREPDPLELELKIFMGYGVGAGNRTPELSL